MGESEWEAGRVISHRPAFFDEDFIGIFLAQGDDGALYQIGTHPSTGGFEDAGKALFGDKAQVHQALLHGCVAGNPDNACLVAGVYMA